MIVDVHAHVIVPQITREAGGDEPWRPSVRWEDGAQIVELDGRVIRSAIREFVRIDRILEEAATAEVEHLVLSPWVNLLPFGLRTSQAVDVCRLQNEALAEAAAEHDGRISALGAVPMQEPAVAAGELERLMSMPGLHGVELAASVQGVYLGDDRFTPFWEAAQATGAMVFVHPTTRGFDLPVFDEYYLWNTVGNPMETAVTGSHLVMAGVLERYPDLRIVLAHGGGALLAVRGRLRHAFDVQPQARSRLEGAPDESLRRLYFDTVTHDPDLLRELVAYVGAGHVLLGSDHPFDMGTSAPVEQVRALGLARDEASAVLGGNALRLLGMGGA